MSERLVRALQKGGCAVKQASGEFLVWRQRDLRRRPVGRLSGAETETLRVQGKLSVLKLEERQVLVWTGAAYTPPGTTGSPSVFTEETDAAGQGTLSLLQRVLQQVEGQAEQTRLAEAAFDFRADYELASHATGISGMNWQALSAGTRIDGGMRRDQFTPAPPIRAGYRLEYLQKALDGPTMRVLERLIIDEVTRSAMAKSFKVKPATAQQKAAQALCDLAEAYDQKVKRPDRVRLSS